MKLNGEVDFDRSMLYYLSNELKAIVYLWLCRLNALETFNRPIF